MTASACRPCWSRPPKNAQRELAHACLKEARRLRGENPTPCTEEECKVAIMEEMADVALCLDILDDSDYTLDPIIAKAKLDRWRKRLDEAGK